MLTRSSSGMWAGCGGVVIGFPVLYAGIFYDVSWLTILGFIIFAVGILLEPALRFMPRRTGPEEALAGNSSRAAKKLGDE